jgi:hypothetical protein
MIRAGVRAILGGLLVLSLAGCSDDSPADRIVGVWAADYDEMMAKALAQMPPDTDAKRRWVHELVARATVEIKANLSLTVDFTRSTVSLGPYQLPYTVRSVIGDDIVLELDQGGEKKELRLTMRGNDVIDTIGLDGKPLRLHRMYQ